MNCPLSAELKFRENTDNNHCKKKKKWLICKSVLGFRYSRYGNFAIRLVIFSSFFLIILHPYPHPWCYPYPRFSNTEVSQLTRNPPREGNFCATTRNDHRWFLSIASNSKVKSTSWFCRISTKLFLTVSVPHGSFYVSQTALSLLAWIHPITSSRYNSQGRENTVLFRSRAPGNT